MAFRVYRGRLVFTGTVLLLVLFTQPMLAGPTTQTVELVPSGDATLIERNLGSERADSIGEAIYLGTTGPNDGFTLRRALISFDIAASVPAGATIDEVSLLLDVNRAPPAAGGFQTRAYRMLAPWSEGPTEAFSGAGNVPAAGDPTWHHAEFDTILWATPGGDFVSDFSGSVLMTGTGSYTMVSGAGPETLESDVQGWLDDPGTNFGWVLRGFEDPGTTTGKRLNSRENFVPPLLSVTYTIDSGPPPPPPPGPTEVPTTGMIGMLLLAGLLATGGWMMLARR